MKVFSKLFAFAALATFVSASPAPKVEKRQLSGILPNVVCLTEDSTLLGLLGGISVLEGLLSVDDTSLLDCSSDETCVPLSVPVFFSDFELPVGLCE